jgi:hypothetical protein
MRDAGAAPPADQVVDALGLQIGVAEAAAPRLTIPSIIVPLGPEIRRA